MPELIRDTMGFNDGIKRYPMIPNDAVCKVTRGELFQKIDDGYGHTFLKPIASNTVVLGGAILALEKLCGTQASFKPTTLMIFCLFLSVVLPLVRKLFACLVVVLVVLSWILVMLFLQILSRIMLRI